MNNPGYGTDVILEYVQSCKAKASDRIAAETSESLAGPSGFDWVPLPRCELHLYNIRHIQHHAAQLSVCLRRSTGEGVEWRGTGWPND